MEDIIWPCGTWTPLVFTSCLCVHMSAKVNRSSVHTVKIKFVLKFASHLLLNIDPDFQSLCNREEYKWGFVAFLELTLMIL